jgi:serine kinase of HPr protein (carbohydrate metabolism regulator)
MTRAGSPEPRETVHASCVLLGEAAILIRGASGSGKSTLARRLLDHADTRGRFGRLVCDDRVVLSRRHDRVLAEAVPAIAGRLEIRGLGLVAVPWEPAGIVRLVVECDQPAIRLPETADLHTRVLGVELPCISVGGEADSLSLTLWRWRGVCDTLLTVP